MADYYFYDESVVDAIKRADRSMYEAKNRFKEKYGSYR
jgi:PleD family two-component response regulator